MQPIEFTTPLSEVEVRMTLKELCGSRFDDCPFHGEVTETGFTFTKNSLRHEMRPVLNGVFAEKDGVTRVTVLPSERGSNRFGNIFFALAILAVAVYLFVETLPSGFWPALGSALVFLGIGAGFLALFRLFFSISARASVEKLKKALNAKE